MAPTNVLILGRLVLAVFLVAACDAIAPMGNDPVPLPADLAAIAEVELDMRFGPADGSVPPISATKAVEIAGPLLLDELASNNVPPQDTSTPDGLVRRVMTGGMERLGRQLPPRQILPTNVWLVVYRWAAGFNCLNEFGGPGPCSVTSYYVIDDRTGELITSVSITRG